MAERHGSRATLVGVSDGTHENPPRRGWLRRPAGERRPLGWRIGTPAVVLLCGSLFVVSAVNSEGTDLRAGRYDNLASLTEAEQERYDELERQLDRLQREVDALTGEVKAGAVREARQRARELRGPAGLRPERGPGVTVVLSDAPTDAILAAQQDGADLNELVVHQQNIQAVVNAMWRAGAEAVTIQGQRVVTTTGIKCEGNSVLLHGRPYPQPYEIAAVGDVTRILEEIESDDAVQRYVDRSGEETSVGWDLAIENRIVAPAYDGLQDISYAEVLDDTTSAGR